MSTPPETSPLENIFNLPPTPPEPKIEAGPTTALVDARGQRLVRVEDPTAQDLKQEERLEDLAIDSKLERIHQSAIDSFQKHARLAEEVEPRFAARNGEVAAQYLNIALNSVKTRDDAKYRRGKLRIAQDKKGDGEVPDGNTLVIADRNELLKMLTGQLPEKQVQGEVINMEPNPK